METQYFDFSKTEFSGSVAEALAVYIIYGLHPGSYIYYLLTNNLDEANNHKHPNEPKIGWKTLYWMACNLPYESWGSQDKVDLWMIEHSGRDRYAVEMAFSKISKDPIFPLATK